MARTLNRLTARFVQTVSEPGRHADGGGLYLATTGGGRRWIFLFRWQGKPTEMGLGSTRNVSLARARELAAHARDALARGVHPISARDAERHEVAGGRGVDAPQITFGDCADQLLASLNGSWRNAKHAAQWETTLRTYAAPLRPLPIAGVTTANVVAVLQPLWQSKPETASRVRGRIERVLSYGKALGYRAGENPALWRGHLDQILPRRERLTRGHHAALAYVDIPGFMMQLRSRAAVAARALEFAILTAARSGEVLGARWDEIALERAVWTIPPERMKARREHRVPLSVSAIEVLKGMESDSLLPNGKQREFVFPTQRTDAKVDASLSTMALAMVLRRMGSPVTAHGFRSSFRDWTAECTHTPNEVCEAALAHVIENKAEAAYRRGDLFEKRRVLMDEWADYCGSGVKNGQIA